MLSGFATELIVKILLYLPYREFLRAIRLNSRLWSIAHHPKSPLRHRLRGRTSWIYLYLNSNNRFVLGISIDETIPGSTNKRCIKRELVYDIPDEPYVENEEDESIVLMEKSSVQLIYKTNDGLDGTNDSKEKYNFDKFSPDLSISLAVCHLFYIVEYLTINKAFTLYVHDGILLNKFLLHFDAYDIRLAPISIWIYNGKIDLPRLYESKFFQQKIRELSFPYPCKAIGNDLDSRHYEVHRNKLREVKRFTKRTNIPIKHNDDDLLLLDNIEELAICSEDEITGNGIARLIKKIYTNKQGRKINIEIKMKQRFTIEEVLKCVPERKITKDADNDIYFTNMFDEVFKIECYDKIKYTEFSLVKKSPAPTDDVSNLFK